MAEKEFEEERLEGLILWCKHVPYPGRKRSVCELAKQQFKEEEIAE